MGFSANHPAIGTHIHVAAPAEPLVQGCPLGQTGGREPSTCRLHGTVPVFTELKKNVNKKPLNSVQDWIIWIFEPT
jgi:hypothetical protein